MLKAVSPWQRDTAQLEIWHQHGSYVLLIIIYGLVIKENTQLGWQNFQYAVCLRVKEWECGSTCVNGITDTELFLHIFSLTYIHFPIRKQRLALKGVQSSNPAECSQELNAWYPVDPLKIQDTICDRWYHPTEEQGLLCNKSQMLLLPPLTIYVLISILCQNSPVCNCPGVLHLATSYFYAISLHWGSDFSENKEHAGTTFDLYPSHESPTLLRGTLFSLYFSTEFCLREHRSWTWGCCITEIISDLTKP